MTEAKRFRFVSDDDGHTYLIPADKKEAFDRWLEHQTAMWGGSHTDEEFKALEASYTGEDFSGYGINSHEDYTFENPEARR